MQNYIRPLPVVDAPELQFPASVTEAEKWDYLCFAIRKSAEEKSYVKENQNHRG